MPDTLYVNDNGALRELNLGAPDIATPDANGIGRPDDDTLVIAQDGALSVNIDAVARRANALIGAFDLATCDAPGLVRPDCDTVKVDGQGVISVDMDVVMEEVRREIGNPTTPDPEDPAPPPTVITLEPPTLVSATDDGAGTALFTVSAAPVVAASTIASFTWNGEGFSNQVVPATANQAVLSVATGKSGGEQVDITCHATDSLGNTGRSASFSHILAVGPASRHGEVLLDAAGQQVAVLVGSFHSNGREPWTIFGRKVWLAVATAQFREKKQVGWYNVNIPGADSTINRMDKLAPSNTSADASSYYVSSLSTETHMDAHFPNDVNQDSKKKTDLLLQGGHPSNYPPDAATWCRSLRPMIGGVATPMDLPRIAALMRIYQARDLIDAIDPTAAANAANKLQQSTWGFGASYVWSSSVYGPDPTRYDWYVNCNGHTFYDPRNGSYGVVAALEIAAA